MADNALAFDPSIPLGIKVPEIQSGNALTKVGMFSDIQNKLNENRLFQLTLAARQKAGEIMSAAPDLESGIQTLLSNPETAAFVPELAQTMQSIRASQVSVQGEQQTQATTGLEALLKNIYPAMTDPTTFGPMVNATLETLSPSAKTAVGKSVNSIVTALTDGLPEGEAGAADYQQRLASILMSAGVSPDTIRATTGTMAPQAITVTGPRGSLVTKVIGGPVTGAGTQGGDVLNTSPDAAEMATLNATGATAANIAEDMAANAGALPSGLTRLNNMVDALGQFQAGGGADARASAGKALQALKNMGLKGIDQEMIDGVSNGSLSATQIFNANIKPFVVGELKAAAQGTGRVMRSEVDTFLAMADSTTDPAALLSILNQAKKQFQIGYDEARKYLDFKKLLDKKDPSVQGLTVAEFPEWYVMNYSSGALPEKTGGGEDLSPIPAEKLKGTAPAKGDEKPPLSSFFK